VRSLLRRLIYILISRVRCADNTEVIPKSAVAKKAQVSAANTAPKSTVAERIYVHAAAAPKLTEVNRAHNLATAEFELEV
jgi:hypothetical protein